MVVAGNNELEWLRAERPNYATNVDLSYPYSEMPFLGDYYLEKVPPSGELLDHVDYWGEGRLVTEAGASGFPNSYNVNRQYQCVSNGPDTGRKIPNRIPVFSENVCDTSSYIEEGSVKLVTLMGAPMDKCARDMARMINSAAGKVVIFGFSDSSRYVQMLKNELKKKGIFFCFAYPLPEPLKSVTLFNSHHVFINTTEIKEELYNSITGADYMKAVDIFKELNAYGGDAAATEVVNRILEQGIRNTTNLVYHLWKDGGREVVTKYFPKGYELLFSGQNVKITSKQFGLSLKLDSNVEVSARRAWGDDSDKSVYRLKWVITPELFEGTCVFKIMNVQYDLYLMMDPTPEYSYGRRKVWGDGLSDGVSEARYRWRFQPKKMNDQFFFHIVNQEFKQALVLSEDTNPYGDRGAWGHNGSLLDEPQRYGCIIEEP